MWCLRQLCFDCGTGGCGPCVRLHVAWCPSWASETICSFRRLAALFPKAPIEPPFCILASHQRHPGSSGGGPALAGACVCCHCGDHALPSNEELRNPFTTTIGMNLAAASKRTDSGF